MKSAHQPMRHGFGSVEDLDAALRRTYGVVCSSLGARALVMIALLAAGLALSGPWGWLSLCLAAAAGVACVTSAVDLVACIWFMNLVALRDLLLLEPPPAQQADRNPDQAKARERVH